MDEFVLDPPATESNIGYRREYVPFKLPMTGNGYLAGNFPDGITTVEGVPAPATIRVLIRDRAGSDRDGAVVAEVKTSPSGTWKVDGLRTDLRYDVICRHDGYNDMILSNVTPVVI